MYWLTESIYLFKKVQSPTPNKHGDKKNRNHKKYNLKNEI